MHAALREDRRQVRARDRLRQESVADRESGFRRAAGTRRSNREGDRGAEKRRDRHHENRQTVNAVSTVGAELARPNTRFPNVGAELARPATGGHMLPRFHRALVPVGIAAAWLCAACAAQAPSQSATAGGATLYEGARLIVGDGSAIDDSAFLVDNNQFGRVGKKGEIALPAGASRVDLTGKTVMPAIVDAHGHLGFLDGVTGKMSKDNFTRDNYIDHLERYAYHGVAATISTGTDMGELAYQLRGEVIPNAAVILTVGRGLAWPGSGPADPSRNDVPYPVTTPDEARKAVQDLAPHKPDFVKLWVDDRNGTQQKMTAEMYQAAADEARRLNLRVIGHVFDLDDAKGMIRAGVEGFLHSVRDSEVDDEYIRLAKEHNVWITPNLGGINRQSLIREEQGTPEWFDDPL